MNYTTQMDAARKGLITPAMERVAKEENMELTLLQERLAQGTIVIPANKLHTRLVPCGVGPTPSSRHPPLAVISASRPITFVGDL